MRPVVIGFYSNELKHISSVLEGVIKIKFEIRNSSYRGGDYYYSKLDEVEFFLQKNFDLIDKSCFEEEISEDHLILYVSSLSDISEIVAKIKDRFYGTVY